MSFVVRKGRTIWRLRFISAEPGMEDASGTDPAFNGVFRFVIAHLLSSMPRGSMRRAALAERPATRALSRQLWRAGIGFLTAVSFIPSSVGRSR